MLSVDTAAATASKVCASSGSRPAAHANVTWRASTMADPEAVLIHLCQ